MNSLTVVMYHYVRPISKSRFPEIKGLELDDFIAQIKFLKKNYNIVEMEQVVAMYNGDEKLPPNPALLTFDDAYLDHFLHVLPILRKEKLSGAFYCPVKAILDRSVLDVNKIHLILASSDDFHGVIKEIKRLIPKHAGGHKLKTFDQYYNECAVPSRFDPAEVIFIKRLLQRELPEKVRSSIVAELFEKILSVDEETLSNELYMNKYQLEHLVSEGMHVGSHGYNHYWWNRLRPKKLEEEISLSLVFLQQLGVKKEYYTACYPYGSSSDVTIEELKRQNIKIAFTTVPAVADISTDNPLLLPRLDTNDFPKRL